MSAYQWLWISGGGKKLCFTLAAKGFHAKRLNAPFNWLSCTDVWMHMPPFITQPCWCSDARICTCFAIPSTSPSSLSTSFKFLHLSYCTSFLIEVPATILDSGKSPPSVFVNILCTELTMFMDLECHRSFKQWSWPQGPSEIPPPPNRFLAAVFPCPFPSARPLGFYAQKYR